MHNGEGYCREKGGVRGGGQVAAVLLWWGEFCWHPHLVSVGALPLWCVAPPLSLSLSSKVAPPLCTCCPYAPSSKNCSNPPLPARRWFVVQPFEENNSLLKITLIRCYPLAP